MQKLNVQQNNQNVIQAFKNALAIGNLKGIIASDGNHNFSTAGSNRNLLDNPWFTVRQRGTTGTITTVNAFVADRWKKSGGSGSVIIGNNYMTPTGGGGIRQLNEWSKIRNGETYTVSCMLTNGDVYSATGTLSSTASGYQINKHLVGKSLWVGVQNNNGYMDVLFTSADGTQQIMAVKLELGSVSTLANDAPPDYGTEFLKCARYFLRIKYTNSRYPRIGTGVTLSTSNAAILIPTPVPMRATTITVSYSGSFAVISVGSSGNSVSAMSYVDHTAAGVSINCTLSDSVFTPFYGCMLQGQGSTNGYIDLSAEP